MSISDKQTNTASGPRAMTIELESGDVLVPVTPNVADEVHRNPRTVKRWIRDPEMNFPATIRIKNRLYVSRRSLEAWKRALFSTALNWKAA
jgi:hypothetical protein